MSQRIDRSRKLLLAAAFVLSAFGLIMVASTSVPLSQQNFSESYFYFRHQLLFGFSFGLILFLIARFINPSLLKKLALPIFAGAVFLLLLVLIPRFGLETGGAQRWLSLFAFSFQPAELAKLALILYLAAWLDKHRHKLGKLSSLLPFIIITGIVAVPIILQPDIGTAVLIVAVAITMYFLAGARVKAIALLLLLAILAVSALVVVEPYRKDRILGFLNPTSDIQGRSYQLNQALIAIGSGGFFGEGLGHSVQKYQYLPEASSDAIFAIIAEELGFLGVTGVILLFLLFIATGFKIALAARTNFGKLLVVGIVSWIGIQTFLNIGGIIGLIPFTGIPLPFISYGGTALALELAAVGVVVSVSKH